MYFHTDVCIFLLILNFRKITFFGDLSSGLDLILGKNEVVVFFSSGSWYLVRERSIIIMLVVIFPFNETFIILIFS